MGRAQALPAHRRHREAARQRRRCGKELKYVVFDAPKHGGVFEERVAFIEETIRALKHEFLHACEHISCENTEHLKRELARVEGLGGEGLMLRQPRSRYEAGRSNTLLKVKSFHDTEARVLDHLPGMGEHKGRLGALLVELPDGTKFNVGTGFSDVERQNPPKIGSVITFRYQELSNTGVPRFPSYVGERIDGKFPRPAPFVASRRFTRSRRLPRPSLSLHHQPRSRFTTTETEREHAASPLRNDRW